MSFFSTELETMPSILLGSYQMKDSRNFYEIVKEAVNCGVVGFDTSPSYKTEELLGAAIRRLLSRGLGLAREDLFIQTKIDVWQMIEGRGDVSKYVKFALKKMELQYFDAVLIHWPFPHYLVETWDSLSRLKGEGLVRAIGLCNVESRHLEVIEKSGVGETPAIVQNEIHPLHTDIANTESFFKRGIVVQSYSPLGRMLPELKDSDTLAQIAASHKKSIAQVILRWHVQRGLVPIVKTEKRERVSENSDVFSFSLTSGEMAAVSNLNHDLKLFLESRCCPGW